MASDEEALGIDERAETLRNAKHNAADQRAPQRSRPADHRRLKGEDELRRAGVEVIHLDREESGVLPRIGERLGARFATKRRHDGG